LLAGIALGRAPQFKDAAKKGLPVLQEHDALARDMARRKRLSAAAQ
jgi:hypothetical protein